jgi:hypothetical protein
VLINQESRPFMKQSNQGNAYVCSAVGGSVSSVCFEGYRTSPRIGHYGGIRGKIKGFSKVSRRNLLRRLASINRGAFRASKRRLVCVTLTYPHIFPEDAGLCKGNLKALRKRLHRKYGAFAAFWRMGIQKRGAFHFHLLLFVEPSLVSVRGLRSFVTASWYEICGEVSEGHLRAGTHTEVGRSWKQATSYAERYLAKEEESPADLETGRIWGVWNEELLPIEWETIRVRLRDAYRIRRVYRKLANRKATGSLRRVTVFVRYENVIRYLEFLGYRLE